MKSGISPLFTSSDLKKWFDIFSEKSEQKMILLLKYAGEFFVKDARKNGQYKDHTGNLRSSIGYIIVENGEEIYRNFKKQNIGTDGEEGVNKARRLATNLAQSYKKGLVLIGVAGEDYALYVEAIDGKWVISGSTDKAVDKLKRSIKEVFRRAKIKNRI